MENQIISPHESDKGLKIKNRKPKKSKKFKMFSAFTILLIIIAVLALLSWILNWAGVTTEVSNQLAMDQWMFNSDYTWGKPFFDAVSGIDPNYPIGSAEYIAEVNRIVKDLLPAGATFDYNTWTISLKETADIGAAGIVDVLYSPIKGFMGKADVIIFIAVLGAFIQIMISSKALEGFSQGIIGKLKGKEIWSIIPLMIFFSICGTAEGMAEESLGFYMICIPLMMAAGFDKFTGLLIVMIGAGSGVIASTVNPFVISIAIDGLNSANANEAISAGDGLVWRFVIWAVITSISIGYVMWYANRVKKNPSKSVTFATLEGDKKFFLSESAEKIQMTWRRKTSLVVFGVTFLIMIVYLVGWDSVFGTTIMADHGEWINQNIPWLTSMIPGWGNGGLDVVAAIFLIAAIILGLVLNLGEDGFLKEFMSGVNDIFGVCLVIATAAGVGVILQQTHMQELFVKGLGDSVGGIQNEVGKILVLFLIFLPLSFLIPSSSGFAAAVFPLLAATVTTTNPDGTIVFQEAAASGSVTAFSLASGLINLITPTSGVVMGAVAISKMEYGKYIKSMMPIVGILAAASFVMLAIGGAIGGQIA
ncbi:YfcC family protein [Mesoplasma photuris]|uniref:YfcC family protein n=1 Tax=Mesoplasma photuris TaxID=217731 RepID=UPI00068D9153|nr:YfcC family protein [Mesoplasma photuris]